MEKIFLLLSAILLPQFMNATNWLFKNGHTDYTIVLSKEASETERHAAKELCTYIHQMGGVKMAVSEDAHTTGRHIYVGFSPRVASLTGCTSPADTSESFTYRTVGNDLIIFGGRNMGTAYGVYAFLEQVMGVRWYSTDFTKVPRFRQFRLPKLNHHESPVFRHRHVMYYQMHHNVPLNIHNRLNMRYGEWVTKDGYGKIEAFWGGHTFEVLVPPKQYFAKHPEYFSLRNGKRVSDGQLCLSSPKVVQVLKERMTQIVKENPGFAAYGLSQNDNQKFCECRRCQALAQKFGSQSGLLLWAVNQVAEAVEAEVPNTHIFTFAYQYTRKAPRGIRPRHNVIVRLCDIECCFLHPIEGTKENAPFMTDLRSWSALTQNLYIFDYVTGFAQFTAPFPNYHVMAKNLQTFKQHHAIGVLELGQYQSNGGEFAEMKQWILAKLLWNPYQDTERLIRQFIGDYYGPAAPDVLKYYKLCCNIVKADTHMKFDTDCFNPIYTEAFMKEGRKLLDNALKMCRDDSAVTRRVEQVRAQVLYLQMKHSPIISTFDGTAKSFYQLVKRDKIYVHENLPPEEFFSKSKRGFLY